MMTARKVIVLLVFLVMLVKAQEASAALLEALTYAPTSANIVEFTDVDLIKRYEHLEDLTSEDVAQGKAPVLAVNSRHVFLVEPSIQMPVHAQVWQWDITDVRWAVTLSIDVPVTILAFRDDFDLNAFTTLLKERSFSATPLGKVTFYQHELDLSADWLRVNLQMVNTAVLEAQKIVVMSSSPEAVKAVLEAHNNQTTYASVDSIQTIAEQMGEVAALTLENNNCLAYSTIRDRMKSPEEIKAETEKQLELNLKPYQTLALGYRYETDNSLGTLIIHYGNIADAQHDLATRQKIADEGLSFVTNLLYKESVFGLESATANGNNLIFKLRPVDNIPRRLFNMLYQRDMAFAGCP
jgi:hypothetical protein